MSGWLKLTPGGLCRIVWLCLTHSQESQCFPPGQGNPLSNMQLMLRLEHLTFVCEGAIIPLPFVLFILIFVFNSNICLEVFRVTLESWLIYCWTSGTLTYIHRYSPQTFYFHSHSCRTLIRILNNRHITHSATWIVLHVQPEYMYFCPNNEEPHE